MAVRIRLSRAGRTNRPYWRVVAMDSRKKRDGAYIDKLGTYDPVLHQIITLDVTGIEQWIGKGALCSPAVTKLLKRHAAIAGKKDETAVEEAPQRTKKRTRASVAAEVAA